MTLSLLVTVLSQLGLAAAAMRLGKRLELVVANHEARLGVLEGAK